MKGFISITPFSKVSNLFKEAEDATLGGGATIDTTQTDDSGDSVVLDESGEYVEYSLVAGSDLPFGRYLCFYRIKDSNQVADDVQLEVISAGDFLNEENDVVYKTASSSFAYYGLIFDIPEDKNGETVYIRCKKHTTDPNTIYIDYILIVPITDGESLPQDLAHNAMRTFTKRYKVYRR